MSGAEQLEAIKPCAHCGGPGTLVEGAPEIWVRCDRMGCKASTESFAYAASAIRAWNRRTPIGPLGPDALARFQAAWEVVGTLPPIEFSEAETAALFAALVSR